MMTLAIDQGNTLTKLGVFSKGELIHHTATEDSSLEIIVAKILEDYSPVHAVLSSVREDSSEIKNLIQQQIPVFEPDSSSILPFAIDYLTKETLGMDRIANAGGAVKILGDKNVLVVDCGTCITYSLIENKIFKGGAIAPGIAMRFKALNYYTGRLPLIHPGNTLPETVGRSTENAIRSGVELAAIIETDAMIARYCSNSSDLNVLLTGGGMSFFEQHLKSPIFAAPYLTLQGLHEILLLNTY